MLWLSGQKISISISTEKCQQCTDGTPIEHGLRVTLVGDFDASCMSNGLDNLELVDYTDGTSAVFDGSPDDDGHDDGLGGCKNVYEVK